MQGLIGRKVGMTRVFDKDSGEVVPVSVIQTGTNTVCQVKTAQRDGYSAAQLGYGRRSERSMNKPQAGRFKKAGVEAAQVVREFKIEPEDGEIAVGSTLGVEIFENVKFVDVTGISKGRGFTGTIKRYNFHRGRETHGNKNHRERGSLGANTFPGRVMPGLRMAGHSGAARTTMKNLRVVGIDKEAGLILVHGAIPGCPKGIVLVKKHTVKK